MATTRLNELSYSLVNQRTDLDCGIACVAMYARVSYEEALEEVNKIQGNMPIIGLSRRTMTKALKALGINAIESWKFFDGIPTIVSVPSLNTKAAMHYVFWNGNTGEVYDPQAGKEGKEAYNKDFLYRGWSSTIVDVDAAAEGMGVPVASLIEWTRE